MGALAAQEAPAVGTNEGEAEARDEEVEAEEGECIKVQD